MALVKTRRFTTLSPPFFLEETMKRRIRIVYHGVIYYASMSLGVKMIHLGAKSQELAEAEVERIAKRGFWHKETFIPRHQIIDMSVII